MKKNDDPILIQAEGMLFELRFVKAEILTLDKEGARQIRLIQERFEAAIAPLTKKLALLEKELTTLMKQNTAALFDGRDKVVLVNGNLLYQRIPKVKIPRNGVAQIEATIAAGNAWAEEALKIVKSVIREVVEKWPDERLAVIGAERKKVDHFSYETAEDLKKP